MKLGKDFRTGMEGHLHHIQKIPKCWKLTILVKRSLCAFLDAEMTRLGWISDARFCNDREDMLCFLLIKTVECFKLIICRMLSCSNEMKILAPFSILGGVMIKDKIIAVLGLNQNSRIEKGIKIGDILVHTKSDDVKIVRSKFRTLQHRKFQFLWH